MTSITNTQIQCRTSSGLAAATHTITLVAPGAVNSVCGTACTYQATAAKTPTVTSHTPSTGAIITTPAAFSISLTGTNLNAGATTAYLEYVSASGVAVRNAGSTSGNLVVAFTNVPAGVYTLYVNVASFGYASFATAAD